MIKPEGDDPLSLLLSLDRVDDLKLSTQWARDLAIYRLYADLKLGDQDIANLELADVKLGKDEGKIGLPGEEEREKQWVPLTDEVLKAVEAWQTQRGEKPGPLFSPLPLGAAKDRLTTQEIHRIIARARAEMEGQSPPGSGVELEGVDLRRGTWKLVELQSRTRPCSAGPCRKWGLEITKTYRLAKVPGESLADADYPAYHLEFEIEIRNVGEQGARGGLSARRPQRLAHRRQLVCHAGDPLGRIGAPRLHHFVRRRDAGHGGRHDAWPARSRCPTGRTTRRPR